MTITLNTPPSLLSAGTRQDRNFLPPITQFFGSGKIRLVENTVFLLDGWGHIFSFWWLRSGCKSLNISSSLLSFSQFTCSIIHPNPSQLSIHCLCWVCSFQVNFSFIAHKESATLCYSRNNLIKTSSQLQWLQDNEVQMEAINI